MGLPWPRPCPAAQPVAEVFAVTPPARSPSPQPPSRPPARSRRARWSRRLAISTAALVLATSGIGHAVVTGIDDGIDRVDPFGGLSSRPGTTEGMNILLVGTDGRDKITPAERDRYHLGGEPCHCTDTVMMVHLSADRSRASVVSLPRDSYTEVPEHTDPATGRRRPAHPQKLNAAYAEGGPGLTVRTVEHMTGVHLDHYLEVDFTSFMKTVDVLGGVQVCTARPLKDDYSGLDLPAGTSNLNGGEALQYVRSRHLDGASDLGRMQRQQKFLASLIHQATSSGMLLNPMKVRDLASAMLGSVRADRGFGTTDILALGQAMKDFTPASSEFASVPISDVNYRVRDLGSTVKWDETKAEQLFRAIREDRPIAARHSGGPDEATPVDVAPQQIRVRVLNGSGRPGLGRAADRALADTGFRTDAAPTTAQGPLVPQTIVGYDPRWDRSAKSLATALPGSELRQVPNQGPVLTVTLGTTFTSPTKGVHKVRPQDPQQTGAETRPIKGDEVVCP
ncbi:LCP family protein [Streptomyces varsoviensis]|uniref:LCP family protein n=1 Tax=Streptomyces varsoviensis TaxID=67373 RepID=UPI003F4CDC54